MPYIISNNIVAHDIIIVLRRSLRTKPFCVPRPIFSLSQYYDTADGRRAAAATTVSRARVRAPNGIQRPPGNGWAGLGRAARIRPGDPRRTQHTGAFESDAQGPYDTRRTVIADNNIIIIIRRYTRTVSFRRRFYLAHP